MADAPAYDEFAYFADNASEVGLPYDRPPTVARIEVEVEPGRTVSALRWGTGPPELVLPVFPNQQDTALLAQTIGEQLSRTPALAYLVEGHGLTTWAADADHARHHTEALELMLACELATR